ncbi:MAG: hypothetical protein QF476_02775 [Dehalococcoidia bacterium]|nr:hypothetical protein [Dehalococcoidia bacterium]
MRRTQVYSLCSITNYRYNIDEVSANVDWMESTPPSPTSFRQSYVDRDRVENDRFEDDRQRRIGMAIALVPFGIAMAFIVQYINIVVAIDDADWQYVLHRPNFSHILKLSPAPFIGGGLAMLFAGLIATSVAGREGRFLPYFMTAIFYAIFMPLLVSLLLPANLFILEILGLTFSERTAGEAFSSWIWSTPFFVLTYTMTGMKQAFWAGIGSMLMAIGVFRFMGPNSPQFSLSRMTLATTAIGAAVVVVVMFGPLGIFEVLFNSFRITKTG